MVNEYVVYQIKNKITGKIYIGATNNFKRRHNEHKCYAEHEGRKSNAPLYEDMKKYGFDNFEFEILSNHQTREEMFQEEERLIKYNNENNVDNYNVAKGGLGRWTHDVTGENNPMFGKPALNRKKVIVENVETKEIIIFNSRDDFCKILHMNLETLIKYTKINKTYKNYKLISYGEDVETIETKSISE